MATKRKAIPFLVLAGVALAAWWFFFRKPSESDKFAASMAGELSDAFGTDNTIGAAEAISAEHLTLPSTLTVPKNASQ